MRPTTLSIAAFQDQRAGTSGLRQSVARFSQPHYVAAFVQAVFDVLGHVRGKTLLLAGDGRYFSDEARAIIINMAITQGAAKIYLGKDGLMSTPAASFLIRELGADFGLLLTASHNPGGVKGDFGIKLNLKHGEPAPEAVTEAIYQRACQLDSYHISEAFIMPSLQECGHTVLAGTEIEVIDSCALYADLCARLFDLDAIAAFLKKKPMLFDAMHGVTGPYALELFHRRLGLPREYLLNLEPLPDFGGRAPDPNPHNLPDLAAALQQYGERVCLGAASDGDGDRYLIWGRDGFVSPCDSLALIAANAGRIPCLRGRLRGVARSFPTSRALDIVAAHLNILCYETPTGWKFFANLLDHNLVQLCGEESFGMGGNHVREKDGLWAILCWLNILAVSGESVDELLAKHWAIFGRHHFARFDYIDLEPEAARTMLEDFSRKLDSFIGYREGDLTITNAGNFNYRDPLNHSLTPNQGIQLLFGERARIMCRLSGTGTTGATLRIYTEFWQQDVEKPLPKPEPTTMLAIMAEGMLNLKHYCGRQQADAIT